jgi:hypothetical protein
MKQKNLSNKYIWIGAIIAIFSLGFIIYYSSFTTTKASFTLVDDSTGDNRVIIVGTYGLRDHVILLEDRNMEDFCYATIWFNEQQTSGMLKIEMYIDSISNVATTDIGLLGDAGFLYEWTNFTNTIPRNEWVVVTIEYDTVYNKGTLYINGNLLGTIHNFMSDTDYITGFYLRTNPTGASGMYFDISIL